MSSALENRGIVQEKLKPEREQKASTTGSTEGLAKWARHWILERQACLRQLTLRRRLQGYDGAAYGKAMSKPLMVRAKLLLFLAAFFPSVTIQGQTSKNDFSSMVAAGKVTGDVYQNSVLGITLSAPKAHWDVPGPISAARRQGRLIDAVYDSGVPERGPQENYTLALLVESQGNYPKGTTLDQYVRALRQRVEDTNVKIRREAFPLTVRDVAFVGTTFQFYERPDFGYYRGLYSTILKGYFVTVELQCGGEERLQKLLSQAVQITPKR
jgi:hypothetical protein